MESRELVVGVPVVARLILGLESTSRHASKSRARAKFDQAFKLAMRKEVPSRALCLRTTGLDRRGKPCAGSKGSRGLKTA